MDNLTFKICIFRALELVDFLSFPGFLACQNLKKNVNKTDHNRHKVGLTLLYEKQSSYNIFILLKNMII
jgi:hypothetical protein